MQISFLFSYILFLKIYCMYVYVGLDLLGHKDIEQNRNASPPAVSRNTGYFLTHHLRHIANVCVCVYMWEVLQSTPVFFHTSLGGKSLRSLNSPWGFRFPKRPFWDSSTKTNL